MATAAVELPRLPRRRSDATNLRPVERAAWVVACELAIDEADQSIEAKRRGVLALVRRLIHECKRKATPALTLSRPLIAEILGFEGEHAEESVRKLLRRAELAGEIVTYRNEGYQGRAGVRTHKLIVTRLLWRLDALPRPLRLRALADAHVSAALEALRRATVAAEATAIARRHEAAPTPAIAAPTGAACVGGAPAPEPHPPPPGGDSLLETVSVLSTVSSSSPEAPASASEAGGACGPGEERPAGAEIASPAPGLRPVTAAAGPAGPATAVETRDRGADPWRGAVTRGRDGEVRVDLGRLRAVRARCEVLLAERQAEAVRPPAERRRGWRTPEDEARERAELAAAQEREREIRRLAAIIADAKLAARVGWKLHKAAEGRADMLHAESPAERERRGADYDAQLSAETPKAWVVVWSLLLTRVDNARRLDVVARCRARVAGDDLELVAPDAHVAEYVVDNWTRAIAAAARDAGFAGAVRVVAP